ncbi:GNAT family N-acetyltransferase [Microcoleus sp. Pol10D4]|uniref:GNAT family N-acetyltransferase n=1 Tax=Microcoleus sp. Pol10D4 TaxID=3055387 RepID=UPI002FD32FF4
MNNQVHRAMRWPITGKIVTLDQFSLKNITPEYISWLNDPHVLQYSNQRFRQHTQESCLAYFHSFENSDNIFVAVYQDSKFIGTMTAYISNIHQTADLGIMIGDREHWGKGIGKDAWITLMQGLFEQCKLRKITGGTLRCNQAMVKIMIETGMQLDGIRIAQELVEGVPVDILHFAKFYDA